MKYSSILSAFYATPWAILPEKFAEIRAFLRNKGAGLDVDADEIKRLVDARRVEAKRNSPDDVQMVGRVALLPVMGTICQRASLMDQTSGIVSCEQIGATLDGLLASRECKAVVMCFDSPGGSVMGTGELAARIRAGRDQKKIFGFIDPMAASAAYWLCSQCSEICCTPTGQAGAIGVITGHDDITGALEQAGIVSTLIASAPYKTEGYPEQPLTDEARAEMQSKVNAYHAMFVGDVAKGRGMTERKVETSFGGGRMLTAQQAVEAGMVDRIGTLDGVLKRAGADVAPAASDAAKEFLAAGTRRMLAQARARAVQVRE